MTGSRAAARAPGEDLTDSERQRADRPILGVLVIAGVVTVLFLLFGSPLHGWWTDGAAYLLHARNLLEHRPYLATGYTQLPSQVPAAVYPPGLPAVLAIIVYFFGLNFVAIKVLMAAILALSLVAAWSLLRRMTEPGEALVAVLLTALAAEFFIIADHINSDFLFLLEISLWMLWVEKSADEEAASRVRGRAWRCAVAVLLMAAAGLTRSVGDIVLPAALALDALWRRTGRAFKLISAGSFLAFAAIEHLWLLPGQTYVRQLSRLISITTIRRNLIQYPLAIGEILGDGRALAAIGVCLILWGAVELWRDRGPNLWFAFLAVYAAVQLFWPFSDPVRFQIPVIPLLFACMVHPLAMLCRRASHRLAPAAAIGALLVYGLAQRPLFARHFVPKREGMNSPTAMELYRAIDANYQSGDVLLANRPRAFALFTQAPSVGYIDPESVAEFDRDVCLSRTSLVVYGPTVFEDDAKDLSKWVEKRRDDLQVLFTNSKYTLYRVRNSCAATTSPNG
jgi:hypothetical protein